MIPRPMVEAAHVNFILQNLMEGLYKVLERPPTVDEVMKFIESEPQEQMQLLTKWRSNETD